MVRNYTASDHNQISTTMILSQSIYQPVEQLELGICIKASHKYTQRIGFLVQLKAFLLSQVDYHWEKGPNWIWKLQLLKHHCQPVTRFPQASSFKNYKRNVEKHHKDSTLDDMSS